LGVPTEGLEGEDSVAEGRRMTGLARCVRCNAIAFYGSRLRRARVISWKHYFVWTAVDSVYFFIVCFYYPDLPSCPSEEIALVFAYGRKGGSEKATMAR
jgi:hypothetical protein